jgi:hypothetical protein
MHLICDCVSGWVALRWRGYAWLCDVTLGAVHIHSRRRGFGDWRVKMITCLPTPIITIRHEGVCTGWTWLRMESSDRFLRTQKCAFFECYRRENVLKLTNSTISRATQLLRVGCSKNNLYFTWTLYRTRWLHRKRLIVKIIPRIWFRSGNLIWMLFVVAMCGEIRFTAVMTFCFVSAVLLVLRQLNSVPYIQ